MTGYGDTISASPVDKYFQNLAGNCMVARCTVANIPTGAGYAVGCLLQATDTGNNYVNKGSITAASFVLLDSGTAFGLPTSASDATSTTGDSFLLTETTLTTGNGIRVLATTGTFTTGGALFKADLSAAVAGNGFVGVTTGVYTGTGLLLLTANSATTGTLSAISGTGLTSGAVETLTGGGANFLTTGIVSNIVMGAATVGSGVKIVTTGIYTDTTNAVLNIIASSATTGIIAGITTSSSKALIIGLALANPAFQVDSSTASQAAGLKVTGAASGGTVAIASIDSGSNTNLSIDGKGSGTIAIGSISTGAVTITPATTITGLATLTGGLTSIANAILKSGTAVPATAGAVAAGAPITLYSGGITIELTSDVPTHSRNKGSICINTGGSSSSTRLYVNNGTTTWIAITTAS